MVKFISNFTATCSTVTCSFTIDNVVKWARYDGNTLTILCHSIYSDSYCYSYGLSTFAIEKSVTFESCYDSSPGTLFIQGSNDQNDTGTGI